MTTSNDDEYYNNLPPVNFDISAASIAMKNSSWQDLDKIVGPICWDWQDWLARGFLNIFVGSTGEGKSSIALRICASYLLGWPWPDGTPFTGEQGYVVWCESEAAQALNLDRAKKWGLPLDRILSPLSDPLDDFRLGNQNHKAKMAELLARPDVVFTVVDSLSGADPTAEKSTEDSSNVNWLASLARDCNRPIQLTHHLRKRGLFDLDGVITLDRVRGISTILQYSRLIWALDAPDVGHIDNKRLSVIKSNLGKKPEPVGVMIDNIGVLFGAAPEKPHIETLLDKAIDLLMSLLGSEPVRSTIIDDEFKQAGLSRRAQNDDKQKQNIIAPQKSDGWYWSPQAGEDPDDT